MAGHRAWRTVLSLAIAAALLAGLAEATAAEPRPAPQASPSPTLGVEPSPSASPVPPDSYPPRTDRAVPPAEWAALEWSRPSRHARYMTVVDTIAWKGGYVLVGSVDHRVLPGHTGSRAVAWWSPDLRRLRPRLVHGAIGGYASFERVLRVGSELVALSWSLPDACGGVSEPRCPLSRLHAWTSRDGRTWRRETGHRAFGVGDVRAIAQGHGRLLAVGSRGWDSPTMWTSRDGRAWRRLELPAGILAEAELHEVVAIRGGWAVFGTTGGVEPPCCARPGLPVAAAWASSHGRWSRAHVVPGLRELVQEIDPLLRGSSGLVGVDRGLSHKALMGGEQAQLWVSRTGRRWRPIVVEADKVPTPLVGDGSTIIGITVAGDGTASFSSSVDGRDWRSLPGIGTIPSIPSAAGHTAWWTNWGCGFIVPGGLIIVTHTDVGSLVVWYGRGLDAEDAARASLVSPSGSPSPTPAPSPITAEPAPASTPVSAVGVPGGDQPA